jgi:aminocarboxymuconate-semialdehyde decarboxylase
MLKYVLDLQGTERVCLGTDYPFPLGDLEIGSFIEKMNLPSEDLENIFCNSTLKWLNLNKENYV